MKKFAVQFIAVNMGMMALLHPFVHGFDPFSEPPKASSKPARTAPAPSWFSPIDTPFSPNEEEDSTIAQAAPTEQPPEVSTEQGRPKSILINFNNVSIIEYIRFISRISNKNFVFDENDLQFTVTIISEEPATIENIMTALLQVLRIHDLILTEEGNNLIIHKNPKVTNISRVLSDDLPYQPSGDTELVTQVFRLNTVTPENAAAVIKPLISDNALVEVLLSSQHVVVTDLAANVRRIAQLLKSLDSPNSGLVIGQYVSRVTNLQLLIDQAQKIMQPIAMEQPLTFVAHSTSNSIFIVSSPYLVEKTISILQYLDRVDGATRILDLKNLQYGRGQGGFGPGGPGGAGGQGGFSPGSQGGPGQRAPGQGPNIFGTGIPGANGALGGQTSPFYGAGGIPLAPGVPPTVLKGRWAINDNNNYIYIPETTGNTNTPPSGIWKIDENGNWYFLPSDQIPIGAPPSFFNNPNGLQGPSGEWYQGDGGAWIFQMYPGESLESGPPAVEPQAAPPIQNQFYIHKLLYRKGVEVQDALQNIASSLQADTMTEDLIQTRGNQDLINALASSQWLETTNSLVITGVPDALRKVKYLIEEIDTPLRQVFIEMLILQTTLDDSLAYGVSWGTRFGGGNTSGSQGWTPAASGLQNALDTTGVNSLGQVNAIGNNFSSLIPNGTQFGKNLGFNLGIIGQHITHNGLHFNSIGALVNAIHDRTTTNIIMNPKIITEDNSPAEIFVGVNTNFKTQSISNDQGSVLTNNFEFRDVGTKLKVTPYLGPTDLVTLDIAQEISSIATQQADSGTSLSNILPGPTTNVNRTSTRVHVPDGYFLILSGMMQEDQSRHRNRLPCLGGAPLIGAAFSNKDCVDTKRNLMIFIRPKIVDSVDEIQQITRHQQNIWFNKRRVKDSLDQEVDQALDWMNVRPADLPTGCCGPCNYEQLRFP